MSVKKGLCPLRGRRLACATLNGRVGLCLDRQECPSYECVVFAITLLPWKQRASHTLIKIRFLYSGVSSSSQSKINVIAHASDALR